MALKKIGIVQDRAECYMCRDTKGLSAYRMIPVEEYKDKCDEDGLVCYLCKPCMKQVETGFFKNGLIQVARRNWCTWNSKNEEDFWERYPV